MSSQHDNVQGTQGELIERDEADIDLTIGQPLRHESLVAVVRYGQIVRPKA